MDDRIQSCIDHIKSAVDIDPWAAELAEKALRHFGRRIQWEPVLNGIDDDTNLAYDCSECGVMVGKQLNYCPCCGGRWVGDHNDEYMEVCSNA